MTQYKLIKTPEQFIIVSDEPLKVLDYFYFNIDGIQDILQVESEFHLNRIKNNKENFKVIAQQEQIDFNNFEDIVGYVDVINLSRKYAFQYADPPEKIFIDRKQGYIEGFNKANELSSNKEFTLEDMEYCYNTAKRRAVMQEAGLEADLGFKNYIDTYHQQPKEWMIEIAMEKSFTGIVSGGLKPVGEIGSKGLFHHTQLNPKLINGKIQITKIL